MHEKKLNNFYKWLLKNHITAEIITDNDRGYFYNNIGLTTDIITLTITSKSYGEASRQLDNVLKYCKRYGLKNISDIRLHADCENNYYYSFFIATDETAEKRKIFADYVNRSTETCDNLIHNFCIKGIYKSHFSLLEHQLKNIMLFYGNSYQETTKTA